MLNRVLLFFVLAGIAVFTDPAAWCGREVRVVIFDFDTHASENLQHLQKGVSALLPSRIAVPGSIAVLDNAAFQQGGGAGRAATIQEKIAAAKKHGAEYAIAGTITKIGAVISIDAQLLDVRTGRQCLPLVAQCDGLNAVIPELTAFARKAQEKILQEENPQLEDVDAPARVAGAKTQRQAMYDTPPEAEEEDEAPPPPPVRRKRRAPPKPAKPAFVMPNPFFGQTPVYSHDMTGKPLHALASGDVDGDGTPELLAAGQDEVRFFKAGASTLTPCGTITAATDEHIVHIAAGDMNHNNIDELYVSSYEGHHANSFVVEYSQSEYRRIAQAQKLFFRIYQPADDNATLLGQEASFANPFSGTLFHFEWRDGTLQSREEFLMPGGAGIYSFAEGYPDEQEGKVYFVFSKGFLGSDYRFAMMSATGKTLWSDTMKLGGSPNCFTQSLYGDEIQQQQYVPLRIITEEFGPRNHLGVIVGRNSKKGGGVFKKLLAYDQGEVLCLVWDGTDLVTNWTSGVMPGYVADYLLADLDRDTVPELYILTVASQGMFGATTNRITVYRAAR